MFRKPLDRRIEEFWQWFSSAGIVVGSDKSAKELTKQLSKVDKHLVWGTELDPNGGPNTLEISPEGQKEFADLARKLVAAAPKVANWRFVAFRQPSEGFSIELPGGRVSPEDCKVALFSLQGDVQGLRLYMPDHLGEEVMGQLAFLILDHTLGEEVVMRYEVFPPLPVSEADEFAESLLEAKEHLINR